MGARRMLQDSIAEHAAADQRAADAIADLPDLLDALDTAARRVRRTIARK